MKKILAILLSTMLTLSIVAIPTYAATSTKPQYNPYGITVFKNGKAVLNKELLPSSNSQAGVIVVVLNGNTYVVGIGNGLQRTDLTVDIANKLNPTPNDDYLYQDNGVDN